MSNAIPKRKLSSSFEIEVIVEGSNEGLKEKKTKFEVSIPNVKDVTSEIKEDKDNKCRLCGFHYLSLKENQCNKCHQNKCNYCTRFASDEGYTLCEDCCNVGYLYLNCILTLSIIILLDCFVIFSSVVKRIVIIIVQIIVHYHYPIHVPKRIYGGVKITIFGLLVVMMNSVMIMFFVN